MEIHNWQEIEKEQVNPLYQRQVIQSDTMTLVRVHLKKGCVVPEHSHPNEQVSMIQQGALQFIISGKEHVVKTGEVMRIAPNLVHSAQAVEDCVMVEVFSPRRDEWLIRRKRNSEDPMQVSWETLENEKLNATDRPAGDSRRENHRGEDASQEGMRRAGA